MDEEYIENMLGSPILFRLNASHMNGCGPDNVYIKIKK